MTIRRVMTECPHCRGSLRVTLDGNRLQMRAIRSQPESSDLHRLDRESRGLMDQAFSAMDTAFDRVFGKRRWR